MTHRLRLPGFYPITQFYVVAVGVVIAAVNGWLTVTGAILVLGFTCVIMLGGMVWGEARTIHRLVDGQRVDMLSRLDEMATTLAQHGISPPPPHPKEREARAEAAEGGA
jgi:hypothetical protein